MRAGILHLSDLHRDREHNISNSVLLDSLERDRDRYTRSEGIPAPTLAIVSGDLVQGVLPGPDASVALREQYEEAEQFLGGLANRFLGGDRERVVIVPGNHDVSFDHAHRSMRRLGVGHGSDSARAIIRDYVHGFHEPASPIRWSWNDLSFYQIVDPDLYLQRMEPFGEFYQAFYGGARVFSLAENEQYDIFDIADSEIAIAGFSSCRFNDLYQKAASIHPDCIAAVATRLREPEFRSRLKLAVWHHNTNGYPLQTDYMNSGQLQMLIDSQFNLGFHGHQHRPEVYSQRLVVSEASEMVVLSTGSLCAGRRGLPTGHHRCYTIVCIEEDEATLFLRRCQTDDLDAPSWGASAFPGSTGRSKTVPLPSRPLATRADELATVARAEALQRAGDYAESLRILAPLISVNPLAKRLSLESFAQTGDYGSIALHYSPPASAAEFVHLADALWSMNRKPELHELLESAFVTSSADPTIRQEAVRYRTRLEI